MNAKDVQLEISICRMVTNIANEYGIELAPLVEAFKLGDTYGWVMRAELEDEQVPVREIKDAE